MLLLLFNTLNNFTILICKRYIGNKIFAYKMSFVVVLSPEYLHRCSICIYACKFNHFFHSKSFKWCEIFYILSEQLYGYRKISSIHVWMFFMIEQNCVLNEFSLQIKNCATKYVLIYEFVTRYRRIHLKKKNNLLDVFP